MRYFSVIALLLLLSAGITEARQVKGCVTSGKEKLEGVIVTDGTNFTSTRKNGRFSFDIKDDAEFVYIVTPSGYAADWSSGVPAFYQRAEGRTDFCFDLKKTGDTSDYSIIAIADPQTKSDGHFAKFAAEPMADLCRTASEQNHQTVGLVLGDICWDSLEMLDKYKREIVRTGVPFYPVVGNHDHEKEAKGDFNTTASYRQTMGPENYAFFAGNDLVIVLDNIIYDTNKKYQNGYTPQILSWVKTLVSMIPGDAYIYVAQHAPVLVWDNDIKAERASELMDILDEHEFCFVSGHTHINNYLVYEGGAVEHNVAALCGSWWDVNHCTDGTPRGYKVFTKTDGQLTWYYKSVDYPKDYQVQVFEKGESSIYPDSILVNVWDWDPEWSVTWYEDGVFKGELETVMALSPTYVKEINSVFEARGEKIPKYKRPRMNYHYFAVNPGKDAENVRICVRSRFGQTWEYVVNLKK